MLPFSFLKKNMDTYRCAELGAKVPLHHKHLIQTLILCLFKTRFIFQRLQTLLQNFGVPGPLGTLGRPPASINMFCVFLELFYYQISIFIRHVVVLYSQELLRRVAISVAAFQDILVPMPWQEKKIAYPTWWLFLVKRNTSKWLQSDKAQHCNTI